MEYTFRFYVSDENGDEVISQAELQTDFTIHYILIIDLLNLNFRKVKLNKQKKCICKQN